MCDRHAARTMDRNKAERKYQERKEWKEEEMERGRNGEEEMERKGWREEEMKRGRNEERKE